MHNPLVKIEGLSHKYTENWAIKDINLEIDSKGILGLLGSNGAGKSTTMNILCGALNPTEGKVFIDGIDMRENPEEAKRLIGFMPQYPPLYLDLTVEEYLTHCAHLRLIEKRNIKNAVNDAMERCKIPHFRNRLLSNLSGGYKLLLSNLSGGYKQRVSIAQSIIHLPKLVVLDEPNTGLDPNQVIELRALIKDLATERAVILSSHVLSEVQLLCHNIRMIEHGRIVFADTMDAFNNYIEPHSILMTMGNPPTSEELLAIEGVSSAEFLTEKQIRLFFNGNKEISERIIETCVHNKWRLQEINLEKTSLTEVFAHLSNHQKN